MQGVTPGTQTRAPPGRDPAAPTPAFSGPCGPGQDLRPPPPRPHTAAPPPPPRLPRPAAGAGRSQARRPPPRAPPGLPRGGVPPKWHSPHPRRSSQIRWHPAPQPQVAGGGSLCSASRPGPPISPAARPRGLPGPPPRRAEEGREPGGGAGGRVVPGCHFLPPPPRSLRGARPPPPPPLPAGRGGSRLFRVGVCALQRPGCRPQEGPRGGSSARKAGAARPGPLRQRRAGHRG